MRGIPGVGHSHFSKSPDIALQKWATNKGTAGSDPKTLIKIKTTPSPFTFALVLACVLMAVSFTLLHYFPCDYYAIGSLFMLVRVYSARLPSKPQLNL